MNIRAALVSFLVTATLSIPAQAGVHLGAMVGGLSLEMTWEWLPSALTDETIKAGSLMLMTQYFS